VSSSSLFFLLNPFKIELNNSTKAILPTIPIGVPTLGLDLAESILRIASEYLGMGTISTYSIFGVMASRRQMIVSRYLCGR
jgi:purine-cytosine permease-like protein